MSTLYSNFPFLNSETASLIFAVTVPAFGEGIKPLGPSTLPNFANFGIIDGSAINKSKFTLPLLISSIKSSDPTISAP